MQLNGKKSDFTIFYADDGYTVSGKELLGRKMAGNSFLRAIVENANPDTDFLSAYVNTVQAKTGFENYLQTTRPELGHHIFGGLELHEIEKTGLFYIPDPGLEAHADLRLRHKLDAYSLCGITHTTATSAVMGAISQTLVAPVMPWDALICTSNSVLATVNELKAQQQDYLSWRYGMPLNDIQTCQTPVIPLGIHTSDFNFSESQKQHARQQLGLADDEIAFLYVGRLMPIAKAHPFPMYQGLQEIAKKHGKRIVFIECGWYGSDHAQQSMQQLVRELMPDVRHLLIDGRNFEQRDYCWAAGDIFVSLVDNIQETFGITPVEAMACGMPVLISDWNGYKELMSHGEQGFKIPTLMPSRTEGLSYRLQALYSTSGSYIQATVGVTSSVEVQSFVSYALRLIDDPELRKKMGRAGKQHARNIFDWKVVYKQYRALWDELDAIRKTARNNAKFEKFLQHDKRIMPRWGDPAKVFHTYPTEFIKDDTEFVLNSSTPLEDVQRYRQFQIFTDLENCIPNDRTAEIIFSHAEQYGAVTVKEIAEKMQANYEVIGYCLGFLTKVGIMKVR